MPATVVQPLTPTVPISPAEIILTILNEALDPKICPAGAVVGPASRDAQNAGVVSITDAGNTKIDPYVPVLWSRAQIRCLSRTLSEVDRIGYHVFSCLHTLHREVVTMASSGNTYLVHNVMITAGPSSHFDSQVTWEGLMFAEVMVGIVPIS